MLSSFVFSASTNLNIFKVLLIWIPLLSANAPSVEILLLLKSKSISVLFSLRDSPTAAAPSSANPFHDKSSVCRLQLARNPFPMAIPPLPRRWFQLRLRYSSPPLASMAGPKVHQIIYDLFYIPLLNLLWDLSRRILRLRLKAIKGDSIKIGRKDIASPGDVTRF